MLVYMNNKSFIQTIKRIEGNRVFVESKQGNIYPVFISDYVKTYKRDYLEVGAKGLVKRIKGRFYLINILTNDGKEDEISPADMGYNW